ncbi:MAG: hypothetical protein QNJ78_08115, partial [Gammaproteobacteria bacterium]|nr:hypothetical protein [Gammaproteobacteria bacterium]
TADDNAIFALGQDIDKDGVLEAANNEIGVPFGFWERQFAIFAANNLVSRVVGLRDSDDAPTDWYRLRLRIDFDANSGDGSVSLSYKNLSKGDADFTDVANLQDINARLRQNGAPNQAAWDAMFLKLRVDATNIPKVDNLIPNVPLSP